MKRVENDSSSFLLQTVQRFDESAKTFKIASLDTEEAIKNIDKLKPICGSPFDKVLCLACEHVHSHGACYAQN